ncbi:MAG: ABC transporter permease, partial [Roseibium sp.]|nr:ABC transporter permease [Roseibium sp.]
MSVAIAAKQALEQERSAIPLDAEEMKRARAARIETIGRWVLPVVILVTAVYLWDRICVWN